MRKGEQTREKILLRAAALFNEKGYSGASLSDLMRATGLEKGGIYNHFASKEKLALEAFDFALGLIARRFEEALAGKAHAADRLQAIVDVFRDYISNPPIPGGCPLMNTAIENDDGNPALRERARQAMDRWHNLVRRVVDRGVERNQLRPGIDPEAVTTVLIATVEGALMLSKLYRDPQHMYRAADHLSEYIEGLRC